VYNASSDTTLSSILKVSSSQTLKSASERKCLESEWTHWYIKQLPALAQVRHLTCIYLSSGGVLSKGSNET
jgi:hypothetical protein